MQLVLIQTDGVISSDVCGVVFYGFDFYLFDPFARHLRNSSSTRGVWMLNGG